MAIPRVQRPKVAGARRIDPRRAIAQSIALRPAQKSNSTVPATQSAPADPMQSVASSAPAAPKPPSGLFDIPTFTPQNGQPDPRDASYWSNLAKLRFSSEQQYAQGLAEQQRSDTDYADQLAQAIRNRAIQQRGLGEDAIRGNLGASGWLNRNEAEQTTAYTQERSHAQRAKAEEDQMRTAAQRAILQQFQLEAGDLLSEAGLRYAEGALGSAANEEPIVGESATEGQQGKSKKKKAKSRAGAFKVNAPVRSPVKQAIGNRRGAR